MSSFTYMVCNIHGSQWLWLLPQPSKHSANPTKHAKARDPSSKDPHPAVAVRRTGDKNFEVLQVWKIPAQGRGNARVEFVPYLKTGPRESIRYKHAMSPVVWSDNKTGQRG